MPEFGSRVSPYGTFNVMFGIPPEPENIVRDGFVS